VAAAAIARKLLAHRYRVEIVAWVSKVGRIVAEADVERVTRAEVDRTPIRCPDPAVAAKMIEAVEAARKDGDSLGGIVTCAVRGCPAGWGEPVFDRLEADLARAVMSLPASKGFEIGSGFAGTDLTGAEHNDEFYMEGGRVRTRTNRSGGVQGGISNGETVYFRVGFKPTATIMREQHTVDVRGQETTLRGRGRHDPCVLPRAVPMVEAMVALVMADHALLQEVVKPRGEDVR
jgi:chorismate synthase